MALTLQQIRDFVRLHLDLEIEDLPDQVLDFFIREGSRRIERAEPRWPFYETSYSLTQATGVESVPKTTIGADLDQLRAIVHVDPLKHHPLTWVGFDAFQEMRSQRAAQGRPRFFAEQGGSVYFFPTPDQSYDFTVFAYRKPADWVANGAGAVPDMPDELHSTVATWALSKAYAQQEDPELSSLYERQYADELNEFRRRLVITPHNQPLVLNGGAAPDPTRVLVRPRFDWEVM